jgi:hypothetical protein
VYFSPIGNLPKAGKIAPRGNNLISPKARRLWPGGSDPAPGYLLLILQKSPFSLRENMSVFMSRRLLAKLR